LQMTVEELKALSRAVEPLAATTAGNRYSPPVAAYNMFVSPFRVRVTRALNDLTLGRPHEPGLTQELFLMARELPSMRRKAEASVQMDLAGSGG
jgi:hypothetical protein